VRAAGIDTWADARDFRGRANTEAHLEGTAYVAMGKATEVVPKIIAWLAAQFTEVC
jgi:esterase FrsA